MEPEKMIGSLHGENRSTGIKTTPAQPRRSDETRDLARPAFPRVAERAGATTSAMTRDAARLRTVMTRAAESGSDQGAEPVDHTRRSESAAGYGNADAEGDPGLAIGIPMPELTEIPSQPGLPYNSRGGTAINDQELEQAGYRATRIVTPPVDRGSATYTVVSPGSVSEEDATRLRSLSHLEKFQAEHPAGSIDAVPSGIAASSVVPPASPEYEWQGAASAASQSSPTDLWDAAASATTPKVVSNSWAEMGPYRRTRSGGLKRGAVVTAAVLVGTTVGIALYAGGSGYLSTIFSNKNEGVQMLSPSAVTERPQSALPDVASIEHIPPSTSPADPVASQNADALASSHYDALVQEDRVDAAQEDARAAVPAQAVTPVVPDPAVAKPSATATRPAEPVSARAAVKPVVSENTGKVNADARNTDKQAAKKAEEKKPESGRKEPSASSTGSYTVQVRATSDESEANLIAKKLRKKGISNVQVVRSEKNGVPFFRVRFTGTGTSSELQAKVKSAGYADAWVVKQN